MADNSKALAAIEGNNSTSCPFSGFIA